MVFGHSLATRARAAQKAICCKNRTDQSETGQTASDRVRGPRFGSVADRIHDTVANKTGYRQINELSLMQSR